MLKIPSFVLRQPCSLLLARGDGKLSIVPTCCKDLSFYRYCHFIRKHLTHYSVLGVSRDASNEEIKAAYVRLSKKFHPDHNKNKDSAQRFIEINEAYSTLSKADSRKAYDASITPSQPQTHPNYNPESFYRTRNRKQPINSYYYYETRQKESAEVKENLNFADRNPFLFIILFLSVIGFYFPVWRYGIDTLTKPNTSENIQTLQSHIYFKQKQHREDKKVDEKLDKK